MIKKKYIALIIILSLFSVDNVYADDCKMDLIQEFKKIENRYKINYRYNIEKNSYTLILNYSTSKDYEYKTYDMENIECEQINKTTKECHGFEIGTYKYQIDGKNDECSQTVKVMDIEIKELKNYSNDQLCKGVEEFALCQKDYYKDIDYETFISRVKSYKKTKIEKEKLQKIKKQEEEKNALKNNVNTFIEKNKIQIIIVTIFIILVIISSIVMFKSARKSRRLE